MKKRLLSAIIFLPPVFYAVQVGGAIFYAVLTISTIVGFYEFYKAFKIENSAIFIGNIIEVLFAFYFLSKQNLNNIGQILSIVVLIFMIFVMLIYVINYPEIEISKLAYVFLGQVYILFPLLAYGFIAILIPYTSYPRWLVIGFAFLSDSTAMLSGKFFGKKKLAPKLSPAKTIAGVIGSIFGTGVFIYLFTYIFFRFSNIDMLNKVLTLKGFFLIVFSGMAASIVSQIGDLVGSGFKRQTGIKDFGNVIPGHGGILDRLDSIIFTSVFVYILVVTFNYFNNGVL